MVTHKLGIRPRQLRRAQREVVHRRQMHLDLIRTLVFLLFD